MAKAKDEAKVKFTADTKEFNKEIKQSNDTMAELRAELKLNETQMKANGESVEALENRHKILEEQLAASENKTEALSQKLNKAVEIFGENSTEVSKLRTQLLNAQTAEEKIRQAVSECNDKLEAQKEAANQTKTATEKLTDTINDQQEELDDLKTKYSDVAIEYGENSDEAQKLGKKIEELSGELKENKSKLDDAKSGADKLDKSLDDVADEADDADEAFSRLDGAISVFVGNALSSLVEGLGEAAGYLGEFVLSSETAIDNFAAQTGATAAEMAEFEDSMMRIYSGGYGEDLNDIADSMANIKQQMGDIGTSELEKLTTNALILRDTFDFEVNESVRAAKMLMDQFGISSDEAFNLIAQGAQNGLNKNDDLLDSINEYAVHYQQLGYDADGFFNSLLNGTAAGTFSVDKLGDAMKEFGIRTKDTSKTTTDALELIGFGVGDNAGAIADLEEKIAKYEKELKYATIQQKEFNEKASETSSKEAEKLTKTISDLEEKLKYAKLEQEGFNEKTSEVKKAKVADNIAKYSEQLEEAKKKLSELSSTSKKSADSLAVIKNNDKIAEYSQKLTEAKKTLEVLKKPADKSRKSVKELQDQLAAGGETAQDATKEILEALFSMEDEVARNAAGVGLFGTMWEDLGEDAIKALVETEGELESTIETMEEIDDVKYDNVASQFEVLGRKAVTEVAEPIGEKLLPIAEDFCEYASENLDDLIGTAKNVGIAVAGIITVNQVSKMITSIQNIGGAFQALGGLITAHPVGAVATLAIGIGGLAIAWEQHHEEMIRDTWGLTEEEKKLHEAIDLRTQKIATANAENEKAVGELDAEIGLAQNLWAELQTVADENGKIKKGYEDRAKVITDQLAKSLGIEIEIVEGQIVKYGELKKSVEEVIATKRAEALLDVFKDNYVQAMDLEIDAYSEYIKAIKAAEQSENDLAKAEEFLKEAREAKRNSLSADSDVLAAYDYMIEDATTAVDEATKAHEENTKKLDDAQESYLHYVSTIENYDGLMTAVANGDVQALNDAMNNLTNNFKTAENATQEMLLNQLNEFKEQYSNMKIAVEQGMPGVSQAQVDQMADMVAKAEAELDKLPPKVGANGEKVGFSYSEGMLRIKNVVESSAGILVDSAYLKISDKNFGSAAHKNIGDYVGGIYSLGPVVTTASRDTSTVSKNALETADFSGAGVNNLTEYILGENSQIGAVENANIGIGNAGKNALGSVSYAPTGTKGILGYSSAIAGQTGNVKSTTKGVGEAGKKSLGSVNLAPTGKKGIQDYANSIAGQTGNVKSTTKEVAEAGKDSMGSVSTEDTGEDFTNGFISGIKSKLSSLWDAAWGMAKSALSAVQEAIDSNSPSKETQYFGEFFSGGFALGIDNASGEAVDSAANMANDALAELDRMNDFKLKTPSFDSIADMGAKTLDVSMLGDKLSPIDRLDSYLSGAIERTMNVINFETLAMAVEELANRPVKININGREFALATAGDCDKVNGMRSRIIDRGVLLD